MAKQSVEKEVSTGKCRFCQVEFPKNKITQHLKACKARQADMAVQNDDPVRLFQVLVEGKYRPGYWMHVELPADAALYDLDAFLRDTWVECCEHLSEFKIGNVSYTWSPPEFVFEDGITSPPAGLKIVEVEGEEEDEEEDEEEQEIPSLETIAEEISQRLASEFQTDLRNVPLEKIEEKLLQLFSENLPPGMSPANLPGLKPLVDYMAAALQQGTLAEEMEAMEEMEDGETDMDTELGEVLKVGDKFSYVYDFGSSTTLSLRVVAERIGVAPTHLDDEEDEDELEEDDDDELEELEEDEEFEEAPIVIIARNEPPMIICQICGKPATLVESTSEYASLNKIGFCASCAKEQEDPEGLLPVVNSPRVGICGYEGDAEYEDDWEEEDEDEE